MDCLPSDVTAEQKERFVDYLTPPYILGFFQRFAMYLLRNTYVH